ncbi:MAG: PIN domain-containing protein [Candidatus Bathyarchaeia archaeon]
MPVLDTVVIFGAADSNDRHHDRAKRHLQRIANSEVYLGTFALLEFDIVMKSRGLSFQERMEKHVSLLRDYPELSEKMVGVSPATLYLASRLEGEAELEYFDAGVAAEALQLDGTVVSTDRAFDRVEGLKRIW